MLIFKKSASDPSTLFSMMSNAIEALGKGLGHEPAKEILILSKPKTMSP
jgi:hypothetical protein